MPTIRSSDSAQRSTSDNPAVASCLGRAVSLLPLKSSKAGSERDQFVKSLRPQPTARGRSPSIPLRPLDQVCTFHQVNDITKLQQSVPALRSPEPGTYVAFDLDDTLIHRDEEAHHMLAQGQDTLDALAKIEKDCTCLGLTARGYVAGDMTRGTLESLGLRFAGAPGKPGPDPKLDHAGNVAGVYFSSRHNRKGAMLPALLRDFPDLRHLVFVDDQPRNFISMLEAAALMGRELKLTCVRFNRFGDFQDDDWVWLQSTVWHNNTAWLRNLSQADRAQV